MFQFEREECAMALKRRCTYLQLIITQGSNTKPLLLLLTRLFDAIAKKKQRTNEKKIKWKHLTLNMRNIQRKCNKNSRKKNLFEFVVRFESRRLQNHRHSNRNIYLYSPPNEMLRQNNKKKKKNSKITYLFKHLASSWHWMNVCTVNGLRSLGWKL